jgi:general stress protein YciG
MNTITWREALEANPGLSEPSILEKYSTMNCPKCKTEIPDADIAEYLGRKGGSKTGPSKARDPEKMRAAALKRWSEARPKNAKKGGWPKGRKRKP